ncbi:hypothetical protein [Rhodococcus erythropolis]|uniref:Uncharacterized protein n=1 Tax=Rhodococcus erythropolis TaxID=1833 RepID=A0A8I1A132_RHOER|nr:hypothetical protein [Rhodococcus erythropolis]MBH5146797.1 hypothetical protein [Rhodococcus erythropolis]
MTTNPSTSPVDHNAWRTSRDSTDSVREDLRHYYEEAVLAELAARDWRETAGIQMDVYAAIANHPGSTRREILDAIRKDFPRRSEEDVRSAIRYFHSIGILRIEGPLRNLKRLTATYWPVSG